MPRLLAAAPVHVDLWRDRALVVAPLGRVSRHRHAAAALLVGVDGEFVLRVRDGWRRTSAAFIPAGVAHELECGQTLMATLYLFPLSGDPQALAARFGVDPQRTSVDLAIPPAMVRALLEVHRGDRSRAATRTWLDQTIGAAAPSLPSVIDPRIQQAAVIVRERAADKLALAELCEAVGVSESRFMHLFKAEVGIPIRHFRLWERMRLLTEHVARGESLTMAGLAAGFADSSHLSHGFRSMFGIPASRVLNAHSRLRAR